LGEEADFSLEDATRLFALLFLQTDAQGLCQKTHCQALYRLVLLSLSQRSGTEHPFLTQSRAVALSLAMIQLHLKTLTCYYNAGYLSALCFYSSKNKRLRSDRNAGAGYLGSHPCITTY
jgi:hypothetical protein